jgi:hypothetical protein
MPTTERPNPDQQAAQLAAYSLRCNGFVIDLVIVDEKGARISAHRDSTAHHHLEASGFRELEK